MKKPIIIGASSLVFVALIAGAFAFHASAFTGGGISCDFAIVFSNPSDVVARVSNIFAGKILAPVEAPPDVSIKGKVVFFSVRPILHNGLQESAVEQAAAANGSVQGLGTVSSTAQAPPVPTGASRLPPT